MAHRDRSLVAWCRPCRRIRGVYCLPAVVVALVFLLIGPASPAGAQETPRPWVLVAIPETPADEARNDILAEVIADTVELTLKLVGDYVIQPRPDSLARPASSGDAAALADELALDYVVFGRVEEIDDGSTQFSLSVYNREQDEVILEREAVAHSLFETFSVADRLSADLLGAFTGQRIAYGSIELINEAPDPGEYRVLVDGELVGNSLALVERILIGPRRIEIVGVDGTRIESDAFIAEGHRSRLTFSVASPPEEPEVAQALPAEDTPNGTPPDPPEPAEPPLEWRVYPWSRGDPGRRDTPIWTSTFHLIREERSQWGTHGWGGGLTIRRDWGRRHSLMLEYSRMKPDWGDPDNGGGFQSELHAEDVTAETTLTYHPANLYRVATGYGVRLEPAVGVTVMPWWRVALERDGRRAMLQDETGEWMPVSFQEDEERAIFVPEVATGELFWNVVTGPAIAVEGSLRRASVYAVGGISRTIPFTRQYSATVIVEGYDIEGREVPVTGTIDPSWGWYAGLGAGYSWGGDERAVNRAYSRETGGPRPYETYSPEDRAPWGLSVAPSFGAPVIFAPRSNRGTLSWPAPALSLEYARPAGRLFEATVFSLPPVGRASRVLQEAEEGAEPITINSDVRTPVVAVRLAAGRRRELSQRLTLSLGYHISPVFQTSGGGFHSVGEAVGMAGLGPIVSVARAPVGSSSIVFATVVLHTPLALGRTLYSAGLNDDPGSDRPADTAHRSADGYTDRPPVVTASIGVRFRVAGTPARILAAPARQTERALQEDASWWRPAVSLGLGTSVPIADDPSQGTRYSGVLATVPVALHFPFGGEIGLEGSVPIGRTGISAPEAPYRIVDITNQYGTFQVPMDATPRINRITTIEAGYRLRRDQRLSLRPAVRYTWADLELWAIESRLQDGTFLAPGEEHFTRVDPVHFLGLSMEAAWTLRPALTLRATVGASRRISAAETTVTPAFAPTVEVVYPDSLVTLGVAVTVEM